MTDFTPARLAELRAVAEGATPGPWQWMDGGVFHSTSFGWQPVTLPGESAQHIATFDPHTVLALIAALEAKTAEAGRRKRQARIAEAKLTQYERSVPMLTQERDDARAALRAKDSYVGDLEEQIQHIKSLWRAPGRAEADAHRRAVRAEAAIERVKDLHRKGTVYSYEDSCTNSAEEHREEHHRESASSYGEYYCEQMPEYDICIDCSEHADPDQEWPCPTILALETGDDDE